MLLPDCATQTQDFQQSLQKHPYVSEQPSPGTLPTSVTQVQNTARKPDCLLAFDCHSILLQPKEMKRTYVTTEFRVLQKVQRYQGSHNIKTNIDDLWKYISVIEFQTN